MQIYTVDVLYHRRCLVARVSVTVCHKNAILSSAGIISEHKCPNVVPLVAVGWIGNGPGGPVGPSREWRQAGIDNSLPSS